MPSRTEPTVPNTDGRYLRQFANRLAAVLVASSRADYDLGKMVDEIQRGFYWRHWPSKAYPSFGDWCWEVLGFREGKARAHWRIYEKLTAMGFDETSLNMSRVLRIGWSKLILVLRVVESEIQLMEWIDRIEGENLTETTLRYEIAQVKLPDRNEPPPGAVLEGATPTPELEDDAKPAATPPRKRKTKGQAPAAEEADEKPEAEVGDEDEKPEEPAAGGGYSPLTGEPKRHHKWQLVFEDRESMRIWKDALKLIEARCPNDVRARSNGYAASLMATFYMAVTGPENRGGVLPEARKILDAFEATYGVKVQIVGDVTEGRSTFSPERPMSRADAASSFD